MRSLILKPIILFLIIFFIFNCQLAQANVERAYQAYQQKHYDDSFKYFQQSAQLGIADAQLKLANFYINGIGCEVDAVMSYVYIALADDHGYEKLEEILTTVFLALTSEQKIQALSLKQEYLSKYGIDALNSKIAPNLRTATTKFTKAIPLKKNISVRPSKYLLRRNKISSAIIHYDIGFDGKVRDIEVDKNYFMKAVTIKKIIEETTKTSYKPAQKYKSKNELGKRIKSFNHQTVWAQREMSLYHVKKEIPKLYKHIKTLKESAERGDRYAQYELAMLYLVFPALDVNTLHYVEYIKKSAQAALPEAELEYAKLLLQGKYVNRDWKQAISYTYHAAQAGYARAQYKLARHFLSGKVVEKNEQKALFWLLLATDQEEQYAKFWLARLYLTSRDHASRNPAQAKALLTSVAEQQKNNPNWYYFMALAEFQLGLNKHSDSSKELLAQAIDKANNLSWNLKMFNKLSTML